MDFVAGHEGIVEQQSTFDPMQLFFRFQRGFKVQKAEARTAARFAFQTCRVMDPAPQHLKAAANADDFAAVAQMAMDIFIPTLFAQPF